MAPLGRFAGQGFPIPLVLLVMTMAVAFGEARVSAQPRLAISALANGTNWNLSYPASPAVYTLELAADLATGPWQLLGTGNPLVVSPRGPAGFFRLRKLSDFPRLDRNNLLAWRDDAGVVQPVTDVPGWLKRRAAIVAGMQAVMGALPDVSKRVDPDLQIIEDWNLGTYRRQLITYLAEPGQRVPAYLLIPNQAPPPGGQFPAMLCLHQTDHFEGPAVVVDLGRSLNDH